MEFCLVHSSLLLYGSVNPLRRALYAAVNVRLVSQAVIFRQLCATGSAHQARSQVSLA